MIRLSNILEIMQVCMYVPLLPHYLLSFVILCIMHTCKHIGDSNRCIKKYQLREKRARCAVVKCQEQLFCDNYFSKGPSINYVVSVGGRALLRIKDDKGGRGQKFPILRRHSLWTAPKLKQAEQGKAGEGQKYVAIPMACFRCHVQISSFLFKKLLYSNKTFLGTAPKELSYYVWDPYSTHNCQ